MFGSAPEAGGRDGMFFLISSSRLRKSGRGVHGRHVTPGIRIPYNDLLSLVSLLSGVEK